ncbi:hypothetical protein GQ457_08G033990 [Hibiscus cannabinus]
MTKANPIAENYPFDPEIEKTRCRQRHRIWATMNVQNQQAGDNNTVSPKDDVATGRAAMNPPPVRAFIIRDYLEEDLDGLTPAVAMTEMIMQNHEATLKTLETQVGQFAQIMNTRSVGGLPSNTEVPKKITLENCKAITIISSKQLNETQARNQGDKAPIEPSTASTYKNTASIEEDNINPDNTIAKKSNLDHETEIDVTTTPQIRSLAKRI